MEEDDEFGDLYTDVLRPLATSVQSQPGDVDVPTSLHSRPIDPDVDSDDEEILYGAADLKNSSPNFNFEPGIKLNPSIQEKTLTEPRARSKFGGLDLNLDPNSNSKALRIAGGDDLQLEVTVLEKGEGVDLLEKGSDGGLNFMKEDDDLNIIVEERENKDDYLVEKDADCIDKQENMYSSAEQKENTDNYTAQGAAGKIGSEHMIPGLSAKFEDHGGSNLENDWDSDESEDDLQIVLNDNKHGPIGMESIPGMDDEDDEDGDQLVIVADNGDVGHQQQPVVEEQEWKGEEVGPGADGERKELGDAAKASGVQPKIGYSNHMYHHSFHSQFKYVRPGAAPLPGVVHATPGGVQGHLRPLITMGPGAGRGRGDWRPRGTVPLQKGLHPGYGMPVWGHNAAGRGYGSGFDFTLPSHKTIFEVDIDGFEEKPWKLPGIDISDFFNFGLNEESWKDYCKQLEQLRLETTMQSKIRVYESGRTEQDYDPDLPAELAAAVNNQHIPPENANAGMAEAGPSDLARACAHVPSPAPIGRSIPVETGSGDRLPSIDTRRPRMHDSDAIIEIVCHNSNDDDMADQEDNDLSGEDLGRIDDIDDLQRDNAEFVNCFSHAYNGRKGGNVAGGEQLVNRDEIGGEGDPNEERYTKRRGQAKSFETYASDDGGKQVADDQNESSDIKDGKQNPPLSPSCAIASDREQAFGDDVNGESVMGDRSFDMDKEDVAVDVTTSDPLEDGKLRQPENKKKVGSLVEQVSRENSSENGISRSRSSKDHRKPHSGFEDEVLQYRHRPSSGRKSHHERDETGRHHTMGEGREDSYSQKVGAQHMKIENADWRKRTRVEDSRKREHGGEIGFRNRSKVRESERSGRDEHHQSRSQMDNDGSWMVTDHDHDNMKSRTEKLDDVRDKRRNGGGHISLEHAGKEELTYNHSGSSSRRKRERDDIHAKLKDDDMHCVRKKEDGSRQKERGERQAHSKQSHEDILYRREREETRPPVTRSKRPTENKKWDSHSRGKDDYKGSGREYHSKNVGRHSDQLKRRDRVDDDSFSQNKGLEDANAHGNEGSNDEKRGTCERPGTSDGRDVYASDNSRLYEHNKRKEGRKGREFESGEHSSLTPSKRNQDEQSGRICETANSRDKTKQANVEEHREEAPSDEQQTGSRRGHSKMERWTSHLERDLNITSISSPKRRQLDTTYNNSGVSLSSKNVEPSVNDKDAGGETNNVTVKVTEDKHMDTVEKLKKRSERFKLPMPSEKEVMAIKKIESEPLSSAQTEHRPDSEIKPERPARKRRWTGN